MDSIKILFSVKDTALVNLVGRLVFSSDQLPSTSFSFPSDQHWNQLHYELEMVESVRVAPSSILVLSTSFVRLARSRDLQRLPGK